MSKFRNAFQPRYLGLPLLIAGLFLQYGPYQDQKIVGINAVLVGMLLAICGVTFAKSLFRSNLFVAAAIGSIMLLSGLHLEIPLLTLVGAIIAFPGAMFYGRKGGPSIADRLADKRKGLL